MRNLRHIFIRSFRFIPIVLVGVNAVAWAQPAAEIRPIPIKSPPGQALTVTEEQAVLSALFAHKAVSEKSVNHKVRSLRVKHGYVTTSQDSPKQKEYRATVLMVDYTAGTTTEYGLDVDTGALLSEEVLRGRPQSSAEEFQIAAKVIRKDPVLGKLLKTSAPLAGGFVVDAPPGKSVLHRYVQMKIFRADLARTLRTVVVDLTDETVASSN